MWIVLSKAIASSLKTMEHTTIWLKVILREVLKLNFFLRNSGNWSLNYFSTRTPLHICFSMIFAIIVCFFFGVYTFSSTTFASFFFSNNLLFFKHCLLLICESSAQVLLSFLLPSSVNKSIKHENESCKYIYFYDWLIK